MSEQRPPDRNPRKNGRTPPNGGGMRVGRGLLGWVLFIGLAITLFMLINRNSKNYQTIPISVFEADLSGGMVKSLVIDGDNVTGEFNVKTTVPGSSVPVTNFQVTYPTGTFSGGSNALQHILDKSNGATVDARNDSNLLLNILLPLVP